MAPGQPKRDTVPSFVWLCFPMGQGPHCCVRRSIPTCLRRAGALSPQGREPRSKGLGQACRPCPHVLPCLPESVGSRGGHSLCHGEKRRTLGGSSAMKPGLKEETALGEDKGHSLGNGQRGMGNNMCHTQSKEARQAGAGVLGIYESPMAVFGLYIPVPSVHWNFLEGRKCSLSGLSTTVTTNHMTPLNT